MTLFFIEHGVNGAVLRTAHNSPGWILAIKVSTDPHKIHVRRLQLDEIHHFDLALVAP